MLFPYLEPVCHGLCDLSQLSVGICWRSFCARIRPTGFVTWSVSRCSPSFVALHLTLFSFRGHLLTPSSNSGFILIGQLKQEGDSMPLTVTTSFTLPVFPLKCPRLWPAWTWAQPHGRLPEPKTRVYMCEMRNSADSSYFCDTCGNSWSWFSIFIVWQILLSSVHT